MPVKEFSINDLQDFITGNFAVNCNTKEKVIEFLNILNSTKVKWSNGNTASEEIKYWEYYKHETCFRVDQEDGFLYFGDIKYYQTRLYPIISFKKTIVETDWKQDYKNWKGDSP